MPVELDTRFLGLWLDEELLREEFDAIIDAGWCRGQDRPAPRRRRSPGLSRTDRSQPSGRRGGSIDVPDARVTDPAGPGRPRVVGERGPPESACPMRCNPNRPE
jgi:hypothetical protein